MRPNVVEKRKRLRGRMPVSIALPYADERYFGTNCVDDALGERRLRTVVTDFVDIDVPQRSLIDHLFQLFGFGVAAEQCRPRAPTRRKRGKQAKAIGIAALVGKPVWPDHLQGKVPAGNRIPNSKRFDIGGSHDRRRTLDEAFARLAIAGDGILRHEHAIDRHDAVKRLQRTAMVIVGVAYDHCVKVEDPLPRKCFLEECVVVSRVDEDCRPFASHEERVPLRDVEHNDLAWPEKRNNDDEHDGARTDR